MKRKSMKGLALLMIVFTVLSAFLPATYSASFADPGNGNGQGQPIVEEPAVQDLPPADQPPAEQPPAEEPPTDDPPVEEPVIQDLPPAEEPPAEEPPVEEPPTEEPPLAAPLFEDPFNDEFGIAPMTFHGPSWDKSSLKFTTEGGDCEEIFAIVKNGGDRAMLGGSTWELYWSATGNPKYGSLIATGSIPALAKNGTFTMTYDPSNNSYGPNGNYMFKAYQRPGHPGTGVLWSDIISLSGCTVKGELVINKSFAQGDSFPVEFKLYTGSGFTTLVESKMTSSNAVSFTNLNLNQAYKVFEVVPSGYYNSIPSGHEFTLTAGAGKKLTLEVVNTPIPKGSIKVIKSFNDSANFPVSFNLKDNGGNIIETKSTSGGEVTFSNLTVGSTYTLEEITPSGYTSSIAGGYTFTVDGADGYSKIHLTKNVENVADPYLKITKVFADEKPQVVTFKLYQGDDVVATQSTVDGKAFFGSLVIGQTYTLKEVVPEGYKTSIPVGGYTFTVSSENKYFEYTVTNTPDIKGSITIYKEFSDESDKSVQFKLYKGETFVTDAYTEMGMAKFSGLELGATYTIMETVPAGYETSIPEGYTFTVDASNPDITYTVTNTLIPKGKLVVTKVFSDESDKSVTFQLFVGDEKIAEASTVNGVATFENLDINTDIKLVEVVPKGYYNDLPDGGYDFSFNWENLEESITVTNTKITLKGSITVTKVFSDEKYQAVDFVLKKGEETVKTVSTGETGTAQFTDLDLNVAYTLFEVVPSGYTSSIPEGYTFTLVQDEESDVNTKDIKLTVTNTPVIPTGNLTVNKTFSNGNTSEVTVILYEVTPQGNVEVDRKVTISRTIGFAGLSLSKSYSIAEVPVSGYNGSYPDGQSVVFGENNSATLRILNTLIPTTPPTDPPTNPPVNPPTGGGGGGGDDDPPQTVAVPGEPTPLAAPAGTTIVEEPVPESAPAVDVAEVVEEDVPLSAPRLPKTGEIPAEVFYGLGSMMAALGVFLRRK